MPSIYLVSPGAGEGKTAVALGLLTRLGGAGLTRYARVGAPAPHPDADFVGRSVALSTRDEEMTLAPGDVAALTGVAGAGPTIVEGDPPPSGGLAPLIVATYRGEATAATALRAAGGAPAVGVILNAVPPEQARYVEREVRPAIEAAGLPLLGVVPETRALRAATAGELARFLDGDVLTAQHALDNLVESFMIGAMSHSGANQIGYFNRMANKGVVTGGNRIDVHLSALATPCQCLILTGGYDPDPVVVERAEAEDVPMIKVQDDTPGTMERIGLFLRSVRVRHPHKAALMADLLGQHVALGPIESALGVRTAAGV